MSSAADSHASARAALEAGRSALVWQRLIADTETPVSAALKLIQSGRGDFILESVEGGATRGRYSLIGLAPDLVFRANGTSCEINRDWRTDREAFKALEADPLTALRSVHADEDCDCATFLYTWVGADHVRARMFAPFDNVTEDPATGSASAALGAFLTTLGTAPADRQMLVEQGVEMGRRSLIRLRITTREGQFETAEIGGSSVIVMHGELGL